MRDTDRELVDRQPVPLVQDDQRWGHGVHTGTDARGRLSYRSSQVILRNAWGGVVEPSCVRWIFRLRQLARKVYQRMLGRSLVA